MLKLGIVPGKRRQLVILRDHLTTSNADIPSITFLTLGISELASSVMFYSNIMMWQKQAEFGEL